MVYLRFLEDETFQDSRARLPLAIGKDISGEPIVADPPACRICWLQVRQAAESLLP